MPPEPKSENPQCHVHDKVGFWEAENIRQNVCVNDLPLNEHTDGKPYCLFHLPTQDKDIDKFEESFRARLDTVEQKLAAIEELPGEEREESESELSYDFRYVWFPAQVTLVNYKFQVEAKFSSATFSSHADFFSARFSSDTYFSSATFSSSTDFSSATFSSETDFSSVTFASSTNFSRATFSSIAYFYSVKFSETSQIFFRQTKFCGHINFQYAVFAGYVAFEGKGGENVFIENKEENHEAILNLQDARLEKPERISFHRVRLRPNWFVNTDSRKMIFIDIRWHNLSAKSDNSNIAAEIESLEKREVSEPSRLLEIACRQLGVNAEENNRYEEASQFRYMAMETKRLEYWGQGRFWTLNWWYRFSSGYGESWKRGALVLLGVLLFFGLLYWSPSATFDYGEQKNDAVVSDAIEKESDGARKYDARFHRMSLGEGLVHSLYVAALQRPEPKAEGTLTRFFIILETIFAPLQAALLALAIRRKFMR